MDLLDSLEAGINARPGGEPDWIFSVAKTSAPSPEAVRVLMSRAGMTHADFSSLFKVRQETVAAWLNGTSRIPPWVPAAMQAVEMLTPVARRKLLNYPKPATGEKSPRAHPFAKIEEL